MIVFIRHKRQSFRHWTALKWTVAVSEEVQVLFADCTWNSPLVMQSLRDHDRVA